jgi:preprotein translocase subunit SecG
MTTLLIIIHVTACVILITLVLIQRGRGAGLVESFAGVESMFGTKTSAFLTRTTTIMSIVFFITCLSLAVLSVKQSKSLMAGVKRSTVGTTKPLEAKTESASVAVNSEAAKAQAPVANAPATEAAKPDAAKVQ